MQCTRCGSIVAVSAANCGVCGNSMGTAQVDSYAATSFVPVMQQPVQTMASPAPSPREPSAPTMRSNAPPAAQEQAPKYIIVTQPTQPPPSPYHATMQSAAVTPATQASAQQASAPVPSYGPPMPVAPYAPPVPGAYPMQAYPMMYPQSQQPLASQSTPPLAVAALICGLLGWIPLWIGFILCILAITFSCIVLSQTRSGQPGRGLAITGLVFGLVLLLPAACGL